MFRPGENPYNNCVVYSYYYYITPYNQYKVLDTLQCPEESKYMVKTETKSYCIYDCKEDAIYKYLYNGVCLQQCPEGTNDINYVCQEVEDKCTLGTNRMDNNIVINKETTETLVRTYISEFNYTKKHISLYTNKNYDIIIYENRDCVAELSLEMPKVDFKECYNKVKNEYRIKEELVIVIINSKDDNGGSQTYYSFFHPITGFKLNAENICKNETIVVNQNLTTKLSEQGEEKMEMQTFLTDQGINIFDLNDPFYTDLCYDFDNPSNRDIPLSQRISTIYPNVSLCDEGCKMDGIDLDTMTASCNCKFNDISESNVIKDNAFLDSAFGEVFDMISASNILVVTCYNYIFKYFSDSIGGIIAIAALAGHLISTIIYFTVGKNKITVYIYNIYDNFLSFISKITNNIGPPPKKGIKSKNLKEKLSVNNLSMKVIKTKQNEITTDISERKIKIEKPQIINYNAKDTYNEMLKFREYPDQIIKTEKNLLSEKYDNLNKKNKKYKDINSMTKMKYQRKIKDKDYQKFFDEYLSTTLDDLEYDDAKVKDNRTFCEYLKDCLKERQMIAFTFIANDPIKIRVIKIMLFLLNIILYFVVIGLFYSEEYIGELYEINEEDDGFFDYITRSIDKFIYTTMVSVVISYIIDCFFIDEKKVKGIFKREKDDLVNLKHEIVNIIIDIKNRYLSFIIVVFVLLFLSFYYLLCFNYVYPKSQLEWIKASITIFIIIQILSILKCLLETCLRFLSFYCESEKLFKISKLFA